jgi:hypothetical protein
MKSTKKRPHDQVIIQSIVPAKILRSRSECRNTTYRKDSSYEHLFCVMLGIVNRLFIFGKCCEKSKFLESLSLKGDFVQVLVVVTAMEKSQCDGIWTST